VRKALVVMIAIGLVAAGAWAQTDFMLGPHNTNNTFGCQSCHAPHSQVLAGSGLYMWGLSTPNGSYTTYQTPDGVNSMNAGLTSGTAPSDTSFHTVACLSCHDQTFNPVMAGSCPGGATCPAGQTSPTTNMSTAIPGFTGSGDGMFTTINGGVATSSFNISSNHPVHAVYPNIAGSPATGYTAVTSDTFWALQSASASFVDSTDTTFSYGHPARIFLNSGNQAYIECGSCHDPHSQLVAVVTMGGTVTSVATAHFVRGEYDTTQTQAAFCMSCHADKSAAWNGTGQQ